MHNTIDLYLLCHVVMSTRKKKKSAKQIVAKISSLAEEFIDNQKNANNIVDILEYLQVRWIQKKNIDLT